MACGGTKNCEQDDVDNPADEDAVVEFYSGFESRTGSGAEKRILDDAEVPVAKAQALPQKKQF